MVKTKPHESNQSDHHSPSHLVTVHHEWVLRFRREKLKAP